MESALVVERGPATSFSTTTTRMEFLEEWSAEVATPSSARLRLAQESTNVLNGLTLTHTVELEISYLQANKELTTFTPPTLGGDGLNWSPEGTAVASGAGRIAGEPPNSGDGGAITANCRMSDEDKEPTA